MANNCEVAIMIIDPSRKIVIILKRIFTTQLIEFYPPNRKLQ